MLCPAGTVYQFTRCTPSHSSMRESPIWRFASMSMGLVFSVVAYDWGTWPPSSPVSVAGMNMWKPPKYFLTNASKPPEPEAQTLNAPIPPRKRMSLPWIGLLWSRYIACPLKFDVNTLPGVTWMARGAGAQVLLLPPSAVVPLGAPDATGVPEAPAAAASPLEATPLVARPLVAPLEAMPLVAILPLAAPEELPLVGAPLVV